MAAISKYGREGIFSDTGFEAAKTEYRQDYFSHSKYEVTRNVADYFSAMSINILCNKV